MSRENSKKAVKFHGQEVEDVVVRYSSHSVGDRPGEATIEEFDAAKDSQVCEAVNIQVVSEFVAITFYRDEKANSIIRRELIPTCKIEHVWIRDLPA